MRNKKACGAVLGASAVLTTLLFILGGCGGGSGSDDLNVPPRESFFTPIYNPDPDDAGTFADPLDLDVGEVYRFFYTDDDYDGVTGQEDDYRDIDSIAEGRVVVKVHPPVEQYVVTLVNTFPSPIPFVTPIPWRFNGWGTTRYEEGPAFPRTASLPKPLFAPFGAESDPYSESSRSAYVRRPDEDYVPWRARNLGLQEQFEVHKRWSKLENLFRKVRVGGVDPEEVANITGRAMKATVMQQPLPTPSPLVRDLTPAQLASLSPGDIAYFDVPTYWALAEGFIECRVLSVSPNSIIWGDVDPLSWALYDVFFAGGPQLDFDDPDIVDAVAWFHEEFDTRISPRVRLFYGDHDAARYNPDWSIKTPGIGDVDGDGRVAILMTPWGLGGFVFPYDWIAYDQNVNPVTNEMNMFYINPVEWEEGTFFQWPKELMADIAAHEFLHVVHFTEKTYRRLVHMYGPVLVTMWQYVAALNAGLPEMETWVTEGAAVLSTDITGESWEDAMLSPVGRATEFLLLPWWSLVENSHALWVDGMGYMFFRYLMEQAGGMRFGDNHTWIDDKRGAEEDYDYIAERVRYDEEGIDFLRDMVATREVGLRAVETTFFEYDDHGRAHFRDLFADFLTMLVLDNAKDYRGRLLNTDPKFNLNREAIWPMGIDTTTGNPSGMRTHEWRQFRDFYVGWYWAPYEIDGPLLWDYGPYANPNWHFTATATGGGFNGAIGFDSPTGLFIHFEPRDDYDYSGDFGSYYDSMEFFFAAETPWYQAYMGYPGGAIWIRVRDMIPGYIDVEIEGG